jgi:hypothetical protein
MPSYTITDPKQIKNYFDINYQFMAGMKDELQNLLRQKKVFSKSDLDAFINKMYSYHFTTSTIDFAVADVIQESNYISNPCDSSSKLVIEVETNGFRNDGYIMLDDYFQGDVYTLLAVQSNILNSDWSYITSDYNNELASISSCISA